jgi:hypothetical protein
MLLRFHGLGADPEQIRHRSGAGQIDIPESALAPRSLASRRDRA